MTKIRHPLIEGIEKEVPAKDAKSWLVAGWVEIVPPKTQEPKTAATKRRTAPTRSRRAAKKG